MTLNVQYHFRQTFRCREELVRLKTRDSCQGEKRVDLGQRDDVVRDRIDTKLSRIEVLHNPLVAEFGDISDAVDVLGKISSIFQTEPVSSSGDILSRYPCLIQIRILILDVIGPDLGRTAVVLPIIYGRIKANRETAPAPIIQPKSCPDLLGDGETHLSQKRWSP